MAHILAQKQLRSIILSVSLSIPFSSLPLQCLPLSPPLCLCLSLLLFAFQPLLFCDKNDTCHIFLCYLLWILFPHLFPFVSSSSLSCVKSHSPSPFPSSAFCLLILVIHVQILLFLFVISCRPPAKSTSRLSDPKPFPLSFTFPICPLRHAECDPEQHAH